MATAPHTQNEILAKLAGNGTAPWLDQIRRGLIDSGELERLRDECSLRGVTSNPAIFEQAMLGSSDYDDLLVELAAEGLDAKGLYDRMAVQDVSAAADVLLPVWNEHQDGFVSLEVAPDYANDTQETLTQAREYWGLLDRPNVMIKIPGTKGGVPAIEQAIYEGINVNVTLLFSIESYEQIAEAYIRGLERRHTEGRSLAIHSVASFFVSRVDSEVDKRLEKLGREDLQGTAALANARAAYARFKQLFYGERFAELRAAGANVQRPLWASTGVKNPAYSETMYVDGLVAPDTVNTMPMKTLLEVGRSGEIQPGTAELDPKPALDALADAGIDMGDVTKTLLEAGIAAFVTPMNKLLAGIESRREAALTNRPQTITGTITAELTDGLAETISRAQGEHVAQRIAAKDETLWGRPGAPEIADRLGWLTSAETLLQRCDELEQFAQECARDGLTDAVLLGMGGSSLAPEVLARTFDTAEHALRLHVLDSTDPGAILAVEQRIDPAKTLFVVSTKSGGTIETLSLFEHFHSLQPKGAHFACITDPGSSLLKLAAQHDFRRAWENDPNIGGRYSALSLFGLVPAALIGAPIRELLKRAVAAGQVCRPSQSGDPSSGLWLGLALGELARHGRDKLTFIIDQPVASFGLWVEQLVAESTGKHGRGILPVADEPVLEPEDYGKDRIFIHVRLAAEDSPSSQAGERAEALHAAGHPVLTMKIDDAEDLGQMFFLAEFATAVAGWVLELNPFDQPNVAEAKQATNRVLDSGELPDAREAGVSEIGELIRAATPPSYIALLGYLTPSEALEAEVTAVRESIIRHTHCATTFGYGPRYLHSTGQLHKGGPPNGRFIVLLGEDPQDIGIPGAPYTFSKLKQAQALGDLQTLRAHGLTAELVRLKGDAASALKQLREQLEGVL